jgi:hypothetical protein
MTAGHAGLTEGTGGGRCVSPGARSPRGSWYIPSEGTPQTNPLARATIAARPLLARPRLVTMLCLIYVEQRVKGCDCLT